MEEQTKSDLDDVMISKSSSIRECIRKEITGDVKHYVRRILELGRNEYTKKIQKERAASWLVSGGYCGSKEEARRHAPIYCTNCQKMPHILTDNLTGLVLSKTG